MQSVSSSKTNNGNSVKSQRSIVDARSSSGSHTSRASTLPPSTGTVTVTGNGINTPFDSLKIAKHSVNSDNERYHPIYPHSMPDTSRYLYENSMHMLRPSLNGPSNVPPTNLTADQKISNLYEQSWNAVGQTSEIMKDHERAITAYEHALNYNPYSIPAILGLALIFRNLEKYNKVVEFLQRALSIQQDNGETWAHLGHAYLMIEDLQKSYTAYQQALCYLPQSKLQDPKLWYGIGILYDRYGSMEHAEEAFAGVIKIDPNYEKASEVYFRLGIIYKQQQNFRISLECFQFILQNPPTPLTKFDILFQIGHVYEIKQDYRAARDAYETVLKEDPNHAKVLQQMGWLYNQWNQSAADLVKAVEYLTSSLELDANDSLSWYLLGRTYMTSEKYNETYEAYQQAVYRDGRNPNFWCSIGVLYYHMNQYHDALDAYSRAIRLNPYIPEVWINLGTLYESCNNQMSDAIDAYARAVELDPKNARIQSRLIQLKQHQANGISTTLTSPPSPKDVHPTAHNGLLSKSPDAQNLNYLFDSSYTHQQQNQTKYSPQQIQSKESVRTTPQSQQMYQYPPHPKHEFFREQSTLAPLAIDGPVTESSLKGSIKGVPQNRQIRTLSAGPSPMVTSFHAEDRERQFEHERSQKLNKSARDLQVEDDNLHPVGDPSLPEQHLHTDHRLGPIQNGMRQFLTNPHYPYVRAPMGIYPVPPQKMQPLPDPRQNVSARDPYLRTM